MLQPHGTAVEISFDFPEGCWYPIAAAAAQPVDLVREIGQASRGLKEVESMVQHRVGDRYHLRPDAKLLEDGTPSLAALDSLPLVKRGLVDRRCSVYRAPFFEDVNHERYAVPCGEYISPA